MSRLSDQQLAELRTAGFGGDSLAQAAATIDTEGGGAGVRNSNGNVPESSTDRGWGQWSSFWHPEVSDECADDFACSAREMFRVSKGGTDFGAWVATRTERYGSRLAEYRARVGGAAAAYDPSMADRPSHLEDGGTTPVVPKDGGTGGFVPPSTLPKLPYGGVPGKQSPALPPRGSGSPPAPGALDVPGAIGGAGKGIADAIDNVGRTITQPIQLVESSTARWLWTGAFVGLGALMIAFGLVLYFRQPIERVAEHMTTEAAAVA